jgi:hypothetical protein
MRRPSWPSSITLFSSAFVALLAAHAADEKNMGVAEISADTQKAFAEPSSSSSIVALLKRGDPVSIILKISTSGDVWCRITLPGGNGLTGYVPCKSLAAPSTTTQPSGTGSVETAVPVPAAVAHADSVATAPTPANPKSMSNKDISEMASAGLPPEVLIAKIKSSSCDFDTSPATLKSLKASGVPDAVILAMVEAPAGQPRPSTPIPIATPAVANAATLPSTPVPNDGKTRVLVTDSQSWEARGYSGGGGNKNGWGASSTYSAGARPQTAEIIKTLNERCPQITVTNRLDKADFVLTLDHEGGKGLLQHHNKIALFNKDGDVIFSKSTISLGNSVKDACEAMLGAKQ